MPFRNEPNGHLTGGDFRNGPEGHFGLAFRPGWPFTLDSESFLIPIRCLHNGIIIINKHVCIFFFCRFKKIYLFRI